MFKSYLKTAVRTLSKNKLFSLINILGLSLGLAATMLILLSVHAEMTHDNFHTRGDQIYRVIRKAEISGSHYLVGITSAPFAPALQNDFPGSIKDAVRVLPREGLVTYENQSFWERKFFLADPNFFSVCSFELAKGDPAPVLAQPNSIVLTREMARKYFGDSDPIGKTLRLDNSQLPAFIDKYLGKDFMRTGKRVDPTLQPLSAVYFQNDVRYDPARHGDKNAAFNLDLALHFAHPLVLLLMAGLVVLVSLVASSYPAFSLSSLLPVAVMKNQRISDAHGIFIRKGLVIFPGSLEPMPSAPSCSTRPRSKHSAGPMTRPSEKKSSTLWRIPPGNRSPAWCATFILPRSRMPSSRW